jgi:hypothetical protein
MNQNPGGFHMRHNQHQIKCLMAGNGVYPEHVDQAAVDIPGVGDTADNGNRYLFHPDYPIQTIDGSYEASSITGGQFEEFLPYTLFIVGITVEEHIGYFSPLACLKYGFIAILNIRYFVLLANTRRRSI